MAGNGWHQIHKLLFTRPLVKLLIFKHLDCFFKKTYVTWFGFFQKKKGDGWCAVALLFYACWLAFLICSMMFLMIGRAMSSICAWVSGWP
jgi:hypothetical protein